MNGHRGAVTYCVRADARRSWPTWVALGVLIGLAAGSVMGAAAGARRTASAYQDLVEETAGIDAVVAPACPDPENCPSALELAADLRAQPGIAEAGAVASILMPVEGETGVWETQGDACNTGTGEVSAIVPLEDRVGRDLGRLRILEGRGVDPRRSDEVVLAPEAAATQGVEVGDSLRLHLGPDVACEDPSSWGEPTEVTVVGIGLTALEVRPKSGFYIQGIHLSPALASLDSAQANAAVAVRFEAGTDIDDLEAAAPVLVLVDRATSLSGDEIDAGLQSDANALWFVAVLGALASLAVLGPTLARYRGRAEAVDRDLAALGWSRRDRALRSVAHALAISAVAGVVSLAVLAAASSRTPIGDARGIEPAPGLELDLPVLVLGWAGLTALVVAGLVALALRSSTRPEGRRRTPLARTAARAGLPAPTVLGIRIGLEPGPGQAPVRSSLFAVVLGLSAVVAVLVYTSGAQYLRETPARRGVPWDDILFISEIEDGVSLAERAQAWPEVEATATALYWLPPLSLGPDHLPARAMGFSSGPGRATPTVIDGRAPTGPADLLVNPLLAADLGVDVGDTIDASFDLTDFFGPAAGASEPFTLEVVGTGLVPIGDGRFDTGVAITREGYAAQAASFPVEDGSAYDPEGADFLMLDRADGVEDAAIVDRLAEEGIPYDPLPVDAADFLDNIVSADPTSTEAAPDLLALLMGVMGAAVLAYGLAATIARNGHDLAVTRALGLTPRLLRRTSRWAAVSFTAVALLIAVPVGIAAGRVAWRRYAEGLGVVPDPVVRPGEIAALVAVTLLLALTVATLAARWQSRAAPGEVLRSE